MTLELSLGQARRIALAAQGFGARQPVAPTAAHIMRTADRLNLFQIDSVNVLTRAHYLPAFSRFGPYDRGLLDRAAWGPRRSRRLFEYWGHEASLLPLDLHPLLRWRMARAGRGETGWAGIRRFATERRAEADAVLARIAAEGPMTAADFEHGASRSGWWTWSDAKSALEWLFWAGLVTTATRKGGFTRTYDLTGRVIPRAVLDLPTPKPADARRALVERAARALGVATAADLRDYFRLKPAEGDAAIRDLADDGTLVPVVVRGWRQRTWLHRDARSPRRIGGAALLAPFDPLVWERDRAERLFGFRYRIEIYVPAAKRLHGYYVLPFLLGDALVARVDLKSDRTRSALLVRKVTIEPGAPPETAERLRDELRRLADWLGLGDVVHADPD